MLEHPDRRERHDVQGARGLEVVAQGARGRRYAVADDEQRPGQAHALKRQREAVDAMFAKIR